MERRLLGVCFLLAAATPVAGQVGSGGYSTGSASVSRTTEISYLVARHHTAAGPAQWFQVMILWRGQPGWMDITPPTMRDSAVGAVSIAECDVARQAASAFKALILGGQVGGVGYCAQLDMDRTTLKVLNHSVPVPRSDSAVVVLVDRTDGIGGPPTVAGVTIVDGRFRWEPPPKPWTSGDTTFTVRARDRLPEYLQMVLARDAIIAAFAR